MSMYMWILTLISISIVVLSLRYTLNVAKDQQKLKGDLDSSIPGNVQENIYTKNPVFLAFVGFIALALIIIIFAAINW